MKRALISVSDKTGIVEFAKSLAELDFEIISTGGTFKTLSDNGIAVRGITEITGFPECLDGRLKTLHPKIHGGLLAIRSNKSHMDQLYDLGINTIDVLVVNLYPFKQTMLKENVTLEECIENIDIGGPAMLRSGAKNYQDVSVIVDPSDYSLVLKELAEGNVSRETGFYLSAKVFMHTSHYDSMIADYLKKRAGISDMPDTLTMTFEKQQELRYGENPHQNAAFYKEIIQRPGALTGFKQLHGKELSFNNLNDTQGALDLVKEFNTTVVVGCKHANPCAAATGVTVLDAFKKMFSSDPESIFGGIIVTNAEVDADTATEISKIFIDIVLAKSYSDDALKILTQKKNIRLLEMNDISEQPEQEYDFKKVSGGLLLQTKDSILYDGELSFVTERRPTEKELEDLKFAFSVVKHVKSNAIVVAKNGQTLGIGCGQVQRFWACEQAIDHSRVLGWDVLKSAVLASDGFFPFSDTVQKAYEEGITAIIQPGGSLKDKDSIELCNKYDIAMVLTGVRHFKH